MSYEPRNLKLWTMPESYFGAVWPATYVFLGQHRDSDELTQSNFAVALASLGGESDTINVVRESHWAVGWVEWIAIHQDDETALRAADDMLDRLAEYPVLDEEDWSQRETDAADETWASYSLRDRVELCCRAGVSRFAARRDWPPSDDSGFIQERLLGH